MINTILNMDDFEKYIYIEDQHISENALINVVSRPIPISDTGQQLRELL